MKYMIVFRRSVSCSSPFFLITFCSRCGIEWDRSSQRLEPHMSHFWLFHHLVHRSHFDPQTVSFFQIRQPKIYFKHSCKKKIIIAASLCSKVFLLLFQGDQLNVAWWTEQGFFCHLTGLQPSLSRKLPQTQLANCFESHLIEFPFLFAIFLFQNFFSFLLVSGCLL